jgi:hypothetical protein
LVPGRRGRPGEWERTRRHGEEVDPAEATSADPARWQAQSDPSREGGWRTGRDGGNRPGKKRSANWTMPGRRGSGCAEGVQRSGGPGRGEVSHQAQAAGRWRSLTGEPGGADGEPRGGGSRMEAAREDRPRVAHGPPKTGQPGQRGTQSYSLPPANQASRQNGVLTVGEVTGCRRSSRHWRRERCPLRPPRHVRPQHPVIKWPSSRIGWPCQAKRVGGAHDAAALKSGPEFSSYPEKGPPAAVGVPGGLPEACRAPRCGVTGIDRGRGRGAGAKCGAAAQCACFRRCRRRGKDGRWDAPLERCPADRTGRIGERKTGAPLECRRVGAAAAEKREGEDKTLVREGVAKTP